MQKEEFYGPVRLKDSQSPALCSAPILTSPFYPVSVEGSMTCLGMALSSGRMTEAVKRKNPHPTLHPSLHTSWKLGHQPLNSLNMQGIERMLAPDLL